MAGPWKRYTDEVYRRLRYLAAWPPAQKVCLGEICLSRDRALERQSSVTDLGLSVKVIEGAEVRNLGFTSGVSVAVDAKLGAAGPVHPGVRAGARLEVSFDRKHAVMMRAQRTREDQLERLGRLKEQMLALYAAGEWKEEWIVITHVVHASELVVLISEAAGARVELEVGAGIEAAPAALATGEGALAVLGHSGSLFEQAGHDLTPLYHAIKVRDPWIGEARTRRANKRGRALPGGEGVEVVDVTY